MKEKTTQHRKRFAEVAIEMGFITEDQAKKALMEQLDDNINNHTHRLIGKILLERGWITTKQILKVFNACRVIE